MMIMLPIFFFGLFTLYFKVLLNIKAMLIGINKLCGTNFNKDFVALNYILTAKPGSTFKVYSATIRLEVYKPQNSDSKYSDNNFLYLQNWVTSIRVLRLHASTFSIIMVLASTIQSLIIK